MRLCNLIFLLAISWPLVLSGQTLEWSTRFGGTSVDDGTDFVISESGNLYATGYFKFTASFGLDSVFETLTSVGNDDVFVLKLDSLGSLKWAKRFGGFGRDRGFAIAIDSHENVYVGGQFYGEADLDPSLDTFSVHAYSLNNVDWYDGFVSKFDSAGNFITGYQLGGSSGNIADLLVDSENNLYVTGSFSDTSDLDPGPDTLLTSTGWGFCSFIQKLTQELELLWVKHWGGWFVNSSWVHSESLILDSLGHLYCMGSFSGPIDFNPEVDTFLIGGDGSFLSKFDDEGSFKWVNENVGANSVTTDNLGNLYLIGAITANTDIDPGPNIFNLSSNGGTDIYISKIDSSANLVWAVSMGGTANEWGRSIQLTDANDILFSGTYYDTFDIDPGTDSLILTPPSAGYVAKLNSSLTIDWAVNLGSTIGDFPGTIKYVSPNVIYTYGHFMETGDFDPDTEQFEMTSEGHWDVFIHKMTDSKEINSATPPFPNLKLFSVYPNPSNGYFELEFDPSMRPRTIIVWDSNGSMISEQHVYQETRVSVRIDGPRAVYFIEVIDVDDTRYIRKIVRQ